jgi:hypothetical protein
MSAVGVRNVHTSVYRHCTHSVCLNVYIVYAQHGTDSVHMQ